MLTNALASLKSLALSLFNTHQPNDADGVCEQSGQTFENTDHPCQPASTLPDSESLIQLFKKAECCTLDGLNEYDDDFTTFTPLGNLITHEMKRYQQELYEELKPDESSTQSELEISETDPEVSNVDQTT